MFAASLSIASLHRNRILGSVRKVEPRDAPELARLCAAARVDPVGVEPTAAGGHLLVLDLGGSLCAAEYVVIEPPRARLQLLILDAALAAAGREVEDRMIGVALALCEAYGCRDLDVVAHCRHLYAPLTRS
jgi:hypothetical protein